MSTSSTSSPSTSSAVCAMCKLVIKDSRVLQAMNKEWHGACFKCIDCSTPLQDFYYERDGMPYCQTHFLERFGRKCTACTLFITGPIMAAHDALFHSECFKCFRCSKLLGVGETFALSTNKDLYCSACYQRAVARAAARADRPLSRASSKEGLLPTSKSSPSSSSTAFDLPSTNTAVPPSTANNAAHEASPPATLPKSAAATKAASAAPNGAKQPAAAPSKSTATTHTPATTAAAAPPFNHRSPSAPAITAHTTHAASSAKPAASSTTTTTTTPSSAHPPAAAPSNSPAATTATTAAIAAALNAATSALDSLASSASSPSRLVSRSSFSDSPATKMARIPLGRTRSTLGAVELRQGSNGIFVAGFTGSSNSSGSGSSTHSLFGGPGASGASDASNDSRSSVIEVGDEIVAVNGQVSHTLQDVDSILTAMQHKPGERVMVTVRKSNSSSSYGITTNIAEQPSASSQSPGATSNLSEDEFDDEEKTSWSLEVESADMAEISEMVESLNMEPEIDRDTLLQEAEEVFADTFVAESALGHGLDAHAAKGHGHPPAARSSTFSTQGLNAATLGVAQDAADFLEDDITDLANMSPRRHSGSDPTSSPRTPSGLGRYQAGNLSRGYSLSGGVVREIGLDGGVVKGAGLFGPSKLKKRLSSRIFRLADLEVGELIGKGFYGEVYKVRHRHSGAVMVMKELKSYEKEAKLSFLKEVSLLKTLHHPNILEFIGVFVKEKKLHLITEYIEGGNLRKVIKNRGLFPLPWALRIQVMHDIALGMAFMHTKKVIHRDLKSKNCLVRKNFAIVVADFGLARSVVAGQRMTVAGSPYWMAPEMLRGDEYDASVDVFSFGIVCCEIIGRVKADPDDMPRTSKFGLDIDKFAQLPEVGECPPAFLKLAVDCCAMSPKDRPVFSVICAKLEELRLAMNHPPWHTANYEWPADMRRAHSASTPNLSIIGQPSSGATLGASPITQVSTTSTSTAPVTAAAAARHPQPASSSFAGSYSSSGGRLAPPTTRL
ncbi:testis-specific protein kinase 1 [Capsaspora owczarzaki ATCC 30864]|uniref:testis-specific protein kinase 1 n=1 Tax=Capsaspora owczarzaki (strain ATCC 30864) TaxID=595528 RepID=UPI0003522CDF|nr:testis-specific protein kinase 1 [Capsaspora owczarzaki ATCC 30864]|eukprot:XP_004345437.2 testis-specific protein kinase 1 [Capsaspora owczarzaki ATCC 30864]